MGRRRVGQAELRKVESGADGRTMQVFRVTKVIKSKFTRRTIAKVDGEDLQTQTQTVTTYRVTPVVFEGGGDYKDGVWVKQSEADKYVDDKSARAVLIGKEYSRNLTRAELQKIRRDLPADVAPWSNKKKGQGARHNTAQVDIEAGRRAAKED